MRISPRETVTRGLSDAVVDFSVDRPMRRMLESSTLCTDDRESNRASLLAFTDADFLVYNYVLSQMI